MARLPMRNAHAGSAGFVTGLGFVLVALTAMTAHGAAQRTVDRARLVRAGIKLDADALDGSTWPYDRIQGHITLVDFWAT